MFSKLEMWEFLYYEESNPSLERKIIIEARTEGNAVRLFHSYMKAINDDVVLKAVRCLWQNHTNPTWKTPDTLS